MDVAKAVVIRSRMDILYGYEYPQFHQKGHDTRQHEHNCTSTRMRITGILIVMISLYIVSTHIVYG